MRKLMLLVSVTLAALLTMSSAAADPYAPVPKPLCIIKIVKADVGDRLVVRVGARLNAADQPAGTIIIRLRSGASGEQQTGPTLWTRRVHTHGGMLRVVGPVVPDGTHTVSTRFVPDNPIECRQCQAAQAFDVSDSGDQDDDGDGGGDDGGLLPDTGGPAALWLVVGLTLVGTGAAIVVYSRRRAQVPAH